ncbi:hypothetical protein Lser_V15G21732 [Lactuca serriola]
MVVGVLHSPAILTLVTLFLLFCFSTTTTTSSSSIFNQPPPRLIHKVHFHQPEYHHNRLSLSVSYTLLNRKALAPPTKFNFSPFIYKRHHHRKTSPVEWSVIDPRYGVEMHLVPTGPNPLHH